MANETFAVIRAYGAAVEGEAVVFLDGFSPRYDLDRVTGVISKIGHAQEGRSLSGKILVIPSAKGGVAAGWAFSDMKAKGFAPRGFVFGRTNPVMVQGAVFAEGDVDEHPDAPLQQSERVRRIGVLMALAENDPETKARLAGLRQGLERLGWFEGQNCSGRLSLCPRWHPSTGSGAPGAPERLMLPGAIRACSFLFPNSRLQDHSRNRTAARLELRGCGTAPRSAAAGIPLPTILSDRLSQFSGG